MLKFNMDGIPSKLRTEPRWVCHRNKIPFNPLQPTKKAKVTDPATWASFPKAVESAQKAGLDGVGLVLDGSGLIGVDLDKVVKDGVVDPRAIELLDLVGCQFVEFSPSGTGLHGWGTGPDVGGRRGTWNGIAVEIYSRSRYLTCTGHVWKEGPVAPLKGLASVVQSIRGRAHTPTEEGQKRTEDNTGDLLRSSVGFPARTIATGKGQRHACIFELARWLKGRFPGTLATDHFQTVKDWFDHVQHVVGTQEFAVTWADFEGAWDRVKHPVGAVLRDLLLTVNHDSPLPEAFASCGFGVKAAHLYRVCERLQAHEGEAPFFLSVRQAGELIDMDHGDAAKILRAFIAKDMLVEVTKGKGKFASRYRLTANPP